jgi:HEAT repeat protein
LEVLSAALVDEDPIVYAAAQGALTGPWDWENDGEAARAVLESAIDQLIEHMGNTNAKSDYQEQAAELLYRVGGPRAVEAFITALEADEFGHNMVLRAEIVRYLGKLNDPLAIPVLVAMVEDPQEGMRPSAIFALGDIGGTRVVNTLVEVLDDEDAKTVESALDTLINLDDESLAPLLTALSSSDLRKIADTHQFFIRRGEPNSEELMIQALMAHGDRGMASRYLNSGHEPLEEAAKEWAKANGLVVVDLPSFGGASIRWGK